MKRFILSFLTVISFTYGQYTLYYNFQANDDRMILLNPIELPFDAYKIKEVVYNDQPYTDFNAVTHELHLAANAGGKFKVTYELSGATNIASDENNMPHQFKLKQNYPNPFKPTTVISWQSAVT